MTRLDKYVSADEETGDTVPFCVRKSESEKSARTRVVPAECPDFLSITLLTIKERFVQRTFPLSIILKRKIKYMNECRAELSKARRHVAEKYSLSSLSSR